ncbi:MULTISPECIES: sugar ABC transporter substrate-binding protein [Rhodomicrobium]|uniref:sugar ABC transporter substrate-binding protein n=1 Tax=Rhodomicrobium TaxID=1068 RepID=UPI000B4A87BA|nr:MULTISPECIES: sugar ABC transporter substrate-binding protein [Rhodomicrobium]
MLRRKHLAAAMAAVFLSTTAAYAGPETVKGPGASPECFKPWDAKTSYFKWPAKKGPYKIALANGFVGNTWRIQMIKTAKAFAEQKGIKEDIAEFKVVSTGTDVAAQIAAIDNFINQGYDAIVTIAVNPKAFTPVIKRANKAGVVIVPFDNVVDSEEVLMVNEDQHEMGRLMGDWLVKNIPSKTGKLLEVRGLPGNSVDRDRHEGFRKVLAEGGKFEVVEVVGNWDDGTAQKVVADAIAVHKKFDGMYVQGGTTGAVRAFIDAKHPFIPVSGEGENGFRKLCAQHAKDGLLCSSATQSPALVSIAIKTAISALKGETLPQMISVPIPYVDAAGLKENVNYYPALGDNFFVGNSYPACGVNLTDVEIMSKNEANN